MNDIDMTTVDDAKGWPETHYVTVLTIAGERHMLCLDGCWCTERNARHGRYAVRQFDSPEQAQTFIANRHSATGITVEEWKP